MILGIDPGQTGAIAFIDSAVKDKVEILQIVDMPTTLRLSGKGKEVNAYLLAEMIQDYTRGMTAVDGIVIERVHAMPGQGTTSMFNFGRSLGVIEGIVAAEGIPTTWVTPQNWKKKFGLLKKDKDAARSLVINMFPKQLDLFKRKKDGGRADAVLIGLSQL